MSTRSNVGDNFSLFNSREYQLNPTLGQSLTFTFQFRWISTRSNVGDKLSECKTFTAQFFNFGTACNPSNLFIGISVNNISILQPTIFLHFYFQQISCSLKTWKWCRSFFGDINWLKFDIDQFSHSLKTQKCCQQWVWL